MKKHFYIGSLKSSRTLTYFFREKSSQRRQPGGIKQSFPLAILFALALPINQAMAVTWELPRATWRMPVKAIVVCLAGPCDIAMRCDAASLDNWYGIDEEDYADEIWQLTESELLETPSNGNPGQRCSIATRTGIATGRAFQFFREKGQSGDWEIRSMTLVAFQYMDSYAEDSSDKGTQSHFAPQDEYRFYQSVKGKRLCFDKCGSNDQYMYFKAESWAFDEESLIDSSREFTLFTEGSGILKGGWSYENSGSSSGTLTLEFGNTFLPDDTCITQLTYDSETSGTHKTTCEVSIGDSGPWRITNR